MPERAYLVRHGQTVWNAQHRLQGRQDSPLTPDGIRQACTMAEVLQGRGITTVCSSPLGRALRTAVIIADGIGAELVEIPELIEVDQGAMTGLTWAEIDEQFPGARAERAENRYGWAFPGGESYAQARASQGSPHRQRLGVGRAACARLARDDRSDAPCGVAFTEPPRCAGAAAPSWSGAAGRQHRRTRALIAQQVRATAAGAFDLLLAPPVGDRTVVAAEQDRGHLAVTPDRGLRVRGVFEQAVLMGFFDKARGCRRRPG